MQAFGLLSFLIIVMFVGWWFWSVSDLGPAPSAPAQESRLESYQNAIDSARSVTGGLSSHAVFIYDGITVPIDATEVDLSGKGLAGSLKAEVRQLTELRVLNLSNNTFTGLPAEIGQLTKLEVLNLSNNPLTGLPHELGNLQNLRVLDVSGTNYSQYDLEVITAALPDSVQIVTE